MTGISFARPLSAVDSVEDRAAGDGWFIQATKAVTAADPYMAGHFPGFTIYPAVFIIESVRQAVARAPGAPLGRNPGIRVLKSVRLRAPLLAGDEARLEITLGPCSGPEGGREAEAGVRCLRRDGSLAATLKITFREGNPGAAGPL